VRSTDNTNRRPHRIDAYGRIRRVALGRRADHRMLVDAKLRAYRKAVKHRDRVLEAVAA
jgi:hypothetical protein